MGDRTPSGQQDGCRRYSGCGLMHILAIFMDPLDSMRDKKGLKGVVDRTNWEVWELDQVIPRAVKLSREKVWLAKRAAFLFEAESFPRE